MGLASSFLERHSHIIELMHTIHKNDLKTLKRNIKYAKPTDVMLLLLEAIRKERKQFFDFLLQKFNILSDDLCDHIETGYYEQCFAVCVQCSDPYFAMKLLEVYIFIPVYKRSSLLRTAVQAENEFISHQLILLGIEHNTFDILEAPLEDAVKRNNINLVSMLLYYGAYTNHFSKDLTPFMYSIICECSEDIQKILIDYEIDFNLSCGGISTLFFAISYRSPITLEIIERGCDVNYYIGIHNSVSLALFYDCDPRVFRVIWEKFDYKVWTTSYSKSVLLRFLEGDNPTTLWIEYLKIFMENEEKLQLNLEHHNKSYFYRSDLIISLFYSESLVRKLDKDITESYIFHLLSHGAYIFDKELDEICAKLGRVTPFLESLLYMDFQNSGNNWFSIIYFKYTPVPDLNLFTINNVCPCNTFLNYLKCLRRYYAFNNDLRLQILDLLGYEYPEYNDVCREILEKSVSIPSLLQLSRDSAKQAICSTYNINNSCKLKTIVKHLDLPRYVKNILLFNVPLYYFPV